MENNSGVARSRSPAYCKDMDTLTKVDDIPPYRIVTADVIAQYGERAAHELSRMVESGKIWFPYQRYFRGDPRTMFKNLRSIQLTVAKGAYKLYSYYPEYGSYMPPRFRDQPISIISPRATYKEADVLSDLFIEDVRIQAKRHDQQHSIAELWQSPESRTKIMQSALTTEVITPETLRTVMYDTIVETRVFYPTWAIAIVKTVMGDHLAGKFWLDISAGWGDRLIAAMALDMRYLGYDPNVNLRQGHSDMIRMFGNSDKHRVLYRPFETSTPEHDPCLADVVFSSPPYFTVEEYVPGQAGQSIVSYPTFEQWMVKFMFASLINAWKRLKVGGYLILHLGDSKTVHMCEATNIFIENYLIGSSWEGVLGLHAEYSYPRAVWVWKKVAAGPSKRTTQSEASNTPMRRWISRAKRVHDKGPLMPSERTLYHCYPKLYMAIVENNLAQRAPHYQQRMANANVIRARVKELLPNVGVSDIDHILADNLLISSLLEQEPVDTVVTLCADLVRCAFHH